MKKLLAGLLLYLAATIGAYAGVSCSVPYNLTNGTTADASQVMANYNAILACLLNSTAASGANSDITSLSGLTTPISPSQGGTSVYPATAPATGTANAVTVAATLPSGFGLTANNVVVFVAASANTGPMTLEANGQTVSATTVPSCSSGTCPPSFYRMSPSGPQPMTGGEVQAGQLVVAAWDGTYFELLNPSAEFGGLGPLTNLASGTTTDLGTIASHNVNITGTTTITSFGASAVTTYPIYRVLFAGALTIDYNQTNCATTGGCILTPGNVNITTAANDTALLGYLGAGSGGGGNWQVLNYFPATGAAVVNPTPLCGASGLKITNDSGTPNTKIDITANAVSLRNGTLSYFTTAVSVVVNDTTTGANGLDTGSLTTSTWYNHYLIWGPGESIAGLDSLSATSPTMPSGYTYLCRLGASPTDGSSNFYRTTQNGQIATYTITGSTNTATPLIIASGSAGTYSITSPTLAAVTVTGNGDCAPPTTTDIYIAVANYWKGSNGDNIELAPSTAWGATNNGPGGSLGAVWPFWLGTSSAVDTSAWIKLEASTIAWANNSPNSAIACLGWRDAVNAN